MGSTETTLYVISGVFGAGFIVFWIVGTAIRVRMCDGHASFRRYRDRRPRSWPEIYYGPLRAPYGANWPGKTELNRYRRRFRRSIRISLVCWLIAVIVLSIGQHT